MHVISTTRLSADVTATVVIPDFIAKAKNLDALDRAAVRTTNGRAVGRVVEVSPHGAIPRGMTIAWRSDAFAKAAGDACLSLVGGPGGGLIVHGHDVDPSVGGIGFVAKAMATKRHGPTAPHVVNEGASLEASLRRLVGRGNARLDLR